MKSIKKVNSILNNAIEKGLEITIITNFSDTVMQDEINLYINDDGTYLSLDDANRSNFKLSYHEIKALSVFRDDMLCIITDYETIKLFFYDGYNRINIDELGVEL